MADDDPISLWNASAAEEDARGAFNPSGPVDVAIVGGGFTGLSTALHAAQAGLNAHVLEAQSIGHGGSGRNVGLVNAGVWLPPEAVQSKLGKDYGARFIRVFGDAPSYVFDLIEKHQIRCEATRSGTLHSAHSPAGFRGLQERHAQWQALGAPVDLLGPEEAAAKIGSRAFHGALHDHRAGTINPMGYCRGLARAARAAGATISTGTRVTGLHRAGALWRVETDHGALEATSVILGTNAYTDKLWPGLDRSFSAIRFFQLATEPLGARIADILPGRQGLWDTGTVMLSLRRDMADRLIIGSMGALMGSARTGLSRRWAARQLRRLFPSLGEVRFEQAWDGRIAMTPDHLPRIVRLDDGVYTPIGYNGRGITTGTVFGKAMADLLTGADPSALALPLTAPQNVALAPVTERVYQTAFALNQLVKSI